jgi:hypothetical protein
MCGELVRQEGPPSCLLTGYKMLTLFYLVIAVTLGAFFVGAMFYFKSAATTAHDDQRRAEGKPPRRGQP